MINKNLLEQVFKKVDNMVDWVKILKRPIVGRIIDFADNYLIHGLDYLNEKFSDKIPPELVDNVEQALQCFLDDDYDGILAALPEGVDEVVDIKQLPDDVEAAWIGSNFNALVAFIKYYANKKKEEE
jgi:hypothetical protein